MPMALSAKTVEQTQKLARKYPLREWLWALNLEARNDPEQLKLAALILSAMKNSSSVRRQNIPDTRDRFLRDGSWFRSRRL
jgi:hypothetical protein